MLKDSLKFALLGGVVAGAIGVGTLFTIPNASEFEEKVVKAEETDYSRSLYGVPELNMEHYKLSNDEYLNNILSGEYSVGRANPSLLTSWYSNLKDNEELALSNHDLKSKIYEVMGNEHKYTELKDEIKAAEDAKKKAEEEAKKQAEEMQQNISFQNCTDMREVHPDGVDSSHPAYAENLDRDNDGFACESDGSVGEEDVKNGKEDARADYFASFKEYHSKAYDIDFSKENWLEEFKKSSETLVELTNVTGKYIDSLDEEKQKDEISALLIKLSSEMLNLNDIYLSKDFDKESKDINNKIDKLKSDIDTTFKDLEKAINK